MGLSWVKQSPRRLPLFVRSRLHRPHPEGQAKKKEKSGDSCHRDVIANKPVFQSHRGGEDREIGNGEEWLHGEPDATGKSRERPRQFLPTAGYHEDVDELTVVVADDHRLTVEGLADSLRSRDIRVAGVAQSVPEAQKLVKAVKPDVLLTDLDMGPGPNGIDLGLTLRSTQPTLGVVVLTAFEDPKLLSARIPTFPSDFVYLVKQRIDNLDEVVEACALACSYALGEADPPNSSDRFPLSRSQAEMLRLLASGLSNRAIAEQLSLSEDSVAKSINRLAKKLDVARGENTNVRVSLTQIYFDLMGFQREG